MCKTMQTLKKYQHIKMRTIPVECCIAKGNEHKVFRNGAIVIKTPGIIGRFWQNMTTEAAREDLAILDKYGFPRVRTDIIEGETSLHIQGTEYQTKPTKYCLTQPYLTHETVSMESIQEKDINEIIKEMMSIRHRIYQETGRGVDMMGGNAYKDLIRLLTGIGTRKIDPRINNIGITKDREVVLFDTRLFRQADELQTWIQKIIASTLIQRTHHIETGAISAILDAVGNPVEKNVKTPSKKGYKLGEKLGYKMVEIWNKQNHKTTQ